MNQPKTNMNESEKVNVRIRFAQRVHYDQIVEMPRATWEKLKATPSGEMEDTLVSPLPNHIDFRDPSNADDLEDIEMDVVGDDDEPVSPPDYYDN